MKNRSRIIRKVLGSKKFMRDDQHKSIWSLYFFMHIAFLLLAAGTTAYSLQNDVGAHDPSSIIKCDNTYWIFTTGNGIYSMYSTDLIEWTAGATPFPTNGWPSWITDYVPEFEGIFWAPECMHMNGQYYLYYSCSTWGSQQSVIGLATNPTLDPSSPNYHWFDEGMVIYSNESSDANCIDPALFWDEDGKLWLSYGSYFGGIRVAELNPATGKLKYSTRYSVASGDCEASYVIHHEDYYYLFINRGTCCQGISSTYHIQVGRSANPTGPFLDKDGSNLNVGGGTTILSTSDNFIGPGCLGYFVERGIEWVTFHYYDGDNAGMPTLGIANMRWDQDKWPVITLAWLGDGFYSIANRFNYYVWELADCMGTENEAIVQGFYSFTPCQQWKLTSLENGYYSISSSLSENVTIPGNCLSAAGTPLMLGTYSGESCEIWRIERTNWGYYIIASKLGNRVATLSEENNEEDTPIIIDNYSGSDLQKWIISDTSNNITSVKTHKLELTNFEIFPNPSTDGQFTIFIPDPYRNILTEIIIISSDGRVVYQKRIKPSTGTSIVTGLKPGIYWICVKGTAQRIKVAIF
jgi:arabinan endo-1,5-alpha-L-arabinosidase